MSSLLLAVLCALALLPSLVLLGCPLVLLLARRPSPAAVAGEPAVVAVVIPTLKEEGYLRRRLRDVGLTRYPTDRLRIVVADGGSGDRTRALVQEAAVAGAPVRLLDVHGARSKAAQVNRALREPFVVSADADARLDPDRIRCLVDLLRSDPPTVVVAARGWRIGL